MCVNVTGNSTAKAPSSLNKTIDKSTKNSKSIERNLESYLSKSILIKGGHCIKPDTRETMLSFINK